MEREITSSNQSIDYGSIFPSHGRSKSQVSLLIMQIKQLVNSWGYYFPLKYQGPTKIMRSHLKIIPGKKSREIG